MDQVCCHNLDPAALADLAFGTDAGVRYLQRADVEVQVARGDDEIDLGEIVPDLRLSVAELFGWLSAV